MGTRLQTSVTVCACQRLKKTLVFIATVRAASAGAGLSPRALNMQRRLIAGGARERGRVFNYLRRSLSSVSNCAALLGRSPFHPAAPAPRPRFPTELPFSRRISLKFKLLLIVFLRMPSNRNRIFFICDRAKAFRI